MKHLKMLKHAHNLNPGEIAGFDDEVADGLIESGHGEAHTPEVEEKADKKAEKKAEKGESK